MGEGCGRGVRWGVRGKRYEWGGERGGGKGVRGV